MSANRFSDPNHFERRSRSRSHDRMQTHQNTNPENGQDLEQISRAFMKNSGYEVYEDYNKPSVHQEKHGQSAHGNYLTADQSSSVTKGNSQIIKKPLDSNGDSHMTLVDEEKAQRLQQSLISLMNANKDVDDDYLGAIQRPESEPASPKVKISPTQNSLKKTEKL